MSKTPPIDNLAPLAKAGVPLIHVCGSLDPWLDDQTRVVEQRYKALGGQITVIVKEGQGHFPLAPSDPKVVVDLITRESFLVWPEGSLGAFRRESRWDLPRFRKPKTGWPLLRRNEAWRRSPGRDWQAP